MPFANISIYISILNNLCNFLSSINAGLYFKYTE